MSALGSSAIIVMIHRRRVGRSSGRLISAGTASSVTTIVQTVDIRTSRLAQACEREIATACERPDWFPLSIFCRAHSNEAPRVLAPQLCASPDDARRQLHAHSRLRCASSTFVQHPPTQQRHQKGRGNRVIRRGAGCPQHGSRQRGTCAELTRQP